MRKTRTMKKFRQLNAYLPNREFICFEKLLISGIAYVGDNYKIDRQDSGINVIEFVIEGRGKIKTPDGEIHEVSAGDLYYLPRGAHHLYYSIPEVQWGKIYVNFDGEMWDELFSRFGIANQYIYRGLNVYSELKKIFDLIESKAENTETECASIIFSIICKMYNHNEAKNEIASDALILKKYIDAHFCEKKGDEFRGAKSDVYQVKYKGRGADFRYKLANGWPGAFCLHNVHIMSAAEGKECHNKYQNSHSSDPMCEASPYQYGSGKRLDLAEDGSSGGRESGYGFKKGIYI